VYEGIGQGPTSLTEGQYNCNYPKIIFRKLGFLCSGIC